MRNAAAFAGAPARHFDVHPPVSAVSPPQDAYIRGRDFDQPTLVFDLDDDAGEIRRAGGGAR